MTNEGIMLFHLLLIVGAVFLFRKKWGKNGLGFLFFLFLFLSNLFVKKEINFFSLVITTCDVYTVGSVLCLNLIQEIWGVKESRKFLYKGMAMLVIFLFLAAVHLIYQSAPHSIEFSDALDTIFKNSARIIFASVFVTFVSDRIDLFLFQQLKQRFTNFPFVFRFFSSTLVSQFLDTILFTYIGLYGILEHPWHCILSAYIVKVLCIVGNAIFFLWTKRGFYNPLLEENT